MPNETRIGRGFDIVSPFYDLCVYLAFGNTLNELQYEALNDITKSEKCLIIGGGSGKVLRSCLDLKVAVHYSYCELSKSMIIKTKARLTQTEISMVTFYQDWKTTTPDFDLIVLPFVLDCYTDIEVSRMLKNLSKKLSPNGHVLIVEFNEESIDGFQAKWWQRGFIKLLYLFFGIVAGVKTKILPPIFKIAEESNLTLKNRWARKAGWIQASFWQFIT